jgi:hypothetical protein
MKPVHRRQNSTTPQPKMAFGSEGLFFINFWRSSLIGTLNKGLGLPRLEKRWMVNALLNLDGHQGQFGSLLQISLTRMLILSILSPFLDWVIVQIRCAYLIGIK